MIALQMGCSGAKKKDNSNESPSPSKPAAISSRASNHEDAAPLPTQAPVEKRSVSTQATAAPPASPPEVSPGQAQHETSKSISDYELLSIAIKTSSDDDIKRLTSQMLLNNPNDVKALNALAMHKFRSGKSDYAKLLLDRAVKANPKVSAIYSNLGVIQMQEAELQKKESLKKEAIGLFKKAISINPSDMIASANIGVIYAENRDFQKALPYLDTAYKNGLRDPKFLNNFGISLARMDRAEMAVDVLKQAFEAEKGAPEIIMNYAIVLIDYTKNYKEGLEVLDRLKMVGVPDSARPRINNLENKAKAGLK